MKRRKSLGHALALFALLMLIVAFGWMSMSMQSGRAQQLIGAAITILPLLLFLPGTWRKNPRSFQGLALLAPVYLFIGGIVWLWADWRFGLWICLCAWLLETGAIVHNYRKSHKKRRQ